MEVRVPVSIGELIDKITILKIKQRRITDSSKLENVQKELNALLDTCRDAGIKTSTDLSQQLELINEKLWDIEDNIRNKERRKEFDQEFIELARAVYITNDRRFELKAAINDSFGSKFREEKSYEKYQ